MAGPQTLSVPSFFESLGTSPRQQIVHQAATTTIKEERKRLQGSNTGVSSAFQHFRQPMPLLMQIFQDLSDKTEDFWFSIAPFFKRECIPAGTVLWNQGVVFQGDRK